MDELLTVAEARELGLERWHLRSRRRWRRVGPGIYAPARRVDSPILRLEAASRRLPVSAAFAGFTAAWLHGIDVRPCDPIEAIVPKGAGVSARSGMRVFRSRLPDDDVAFPRGFRATSVLRTLEDLARRLPVVEATVVVDMGLNRGVADLLSFTQRVNGCVGGRGLVTLRRIVSLAEPKAESAMETRMRLALIDGGLPRPEAQVPIYDARGEFVGRPDLFYAKQRLGLEYDGGQHRDQLPEDNRRQNLLLKAGVRLLRFTAEDVISNPGVMVAQVRALLAT